MKQTRREFLRTVPAMALAGSGLLLPMGRGIAEADNIIGNTPKKWYRGSLHMHTYRSDGAAFPEEAAALYKRLGYHFVALTDHNSTHEDPNRWIKTGQKKLTKEQVARFRDQFDFPLEKKVIDGIESFRLRTFAEMEELLNEPDRFLMISGNEVSSGSKNGEQLHAGFLNTRQGNKVVPTATGYDNLLWTLKLRDELLGADNRDTMYIVNHPLWRFYDVNPLDLAKQTSIRFFEVANVDARPLFLSTAELWTHDKFWDVVNAFRCKNGGPLLYGIGSDDTHNYDMFYGKPDYIGYVMVRSSVLSIPALFEAMYRGDFYTSTGLELADVSFDPARRTLRVKVQPRPGEKYTIQFIGTKKGFDEKPKKSFVYKAQGEIPEWALRQNYLLPTRQMNVWSEEIGRVFKTVEGPEASYTMESDDLYVRAKIVTDKGIQPEQEHPSTPLAWTQPVR